ncbi:hypothetical protein N1F78_09700 [Seonamhaeicola sp. MEBiC1930]|uniref:hypothetical protein n=1 Tax=Seonamhaeicola sp. MEBiC01930 TaxID=2976768 RepID=UPI003245794B
MGLGSIQYAITSFKYNRSLLSKRDRLKNRLYGKQKVKLRFKVSNATSYQLNVLKNKVFLENKIIRRKQIVVLIVFRVILVSTFVYLII